MSFCISTVNNFEELPDEILLLICRYLSSTEILYSFYGLNSRLSRTISHYRQHVVLGEVPLMRFNYICTSILPNIGADICSLVVSNDWKGVLSKMFLSYFGETMSSTFPCLRRLILPTYRPSSLMSFVNCLHNLPELFEIKIMSLYEMENTSVEPETLLHQIFTANNNRLTSIVFDDDSLYFPYENKTNTNYLHIEKLVIELTVVTDLHRLLTSLTRLKFLDVTINHQASSESHEKMELIVVESLKHFRLRSFFHCWTLDALILVLKRIPNVQELILEINTYHDTRLIDGEEMFSHLSSLFLTKFSYFLQFDDASIVDETNIFSSWQQFHQEFICIRNDDQNILILYTIPFNISSLFLQYSLAKNKTFSDHYSSQVRSLTLYNISTRLIETFFILNKCHYLERLIFRVDEDIVPQSVQQVTLCKLPYLTFFVALEKASVNADDFKKLLEASPNLYHLAVNFEFITSFYDNESVCYLLKYRITHLLIGISSTTSIQSVTNCISRFSSNFASLKHLYFHPASLTQPVESLILAIFRHLSEWKFLISFGVANVMMESIIGSKNIREWVIEKSFLKEEDSFLTDYSDNTFRLWL